MRQALPRLLRLIAAGGVLSACSGDAFTARGGDGAGGATSSGGAAVDDAGGGGRGTGGLVATGSGGNDAGGVPRPDGGPGTGADGGVAPPRDAGADGADATPPPTCVPAAPAAPGLYADASSTSGAAADGSVDAPFPSLALAVDRALFTGATRVYLAPGSYQGVTISAFSKALTIEGGWTVKGKSWTRDCDPDARSRTTILAASAALPALLVRDDQATVTVAHVNVRTAASGVVRNGVAGSLFGILVQGLDRAPTLALEDVLIITGDGASGVAPPATAKSTNASCDGKTDCVAQGTDGTPGSPGQDSTGGTFGPNGYVPGDGLHGTVGASGSNGAKGSDPGSCTGCFASCGTLLTMCQPTASTTPIVGTAGTCGCGGLAGNPGAPGLGGGASVGLLVSGYATVTLTNSVVQAGRGGDASAGAAGGVAGKGVNGAPGNQATCGTAAGAVCGPFPVQNPTQCTLTQFDTYCTASAGTPGTPGHPGGDGGRGGHGWGGPSYAVVTMTGGDVNVDNTILDFGGSGKNGDGTVPAGNAGKRLRL